MLVTEECIVSIKNEIYHLIGSINFETVAVPINCHFFRCHSVKHEILKFSESIGFDCHCAGIFECDFFHVSTIHDFDPCAYFVCRLCDRPPAAAVLNKKCILRTGTVYINLLANVGSILLLPQ